MIAKKSGLKFKCWCLKEPASRWISSVLQDQLATSLFPTRVAIQSHQNLPDPMLLRKSASHVLMTKPHPKIWSPETTDQRKESGFGLHGDGMAILIDTNSHFRCKSPSQKNEKLPFQQQGLCSSHNSQRRTQDPNSRTFGGNVDYSRNRSRHPWRWGWGDTEETWDYPTKETARTETLTALRFGASIDLESTTLDSVPALCKNIESTVYWT